MMNKCGIILIFLALGLCAQPTPEMNRVHGPSRDYQMLFILDPAMNISLSIAEDQGLFYARLGYGKETVHYEGKLRRSNDTLFLEPNEKRSRLPRQYFSIKWGKFEVLVREWQIMSFINDFNSGDLLRYSSTLDARNLSSRYLSNIPNEAVHTLTGLPQMPKEYTDYLLRKPIEAQVVSTDEKTFLVVIDKGTKNGVRTGMAFFQNQPSYGPKKYCVFLVDSTTSTLMEDGIYTRRQILERFGNVRQKNLKKSCDENLREIEEKMLADPNPDFRRINFKQIKVGEMWSTFRVE